MAAVWSGTIATGNTQPSGSVETGSASHVMIMCKSNQNVSIQLRVSPKSSLRDRTAEGGAATIDPTTDWYALGSAIAVTAGANLAIQAAIGGAMMVRGDITNASGSTATVTLYIVPTINQIGQ